MSDAAIIREQGPTESKLKSSRVLRVAERGLRPLELRPSIPDYLALLWQRRYFIAADARAKAFRSTREYRLWRLWLFLSPLLDAVLYGFLFGFLFKTSRGVDNFVGFLFIGIIFMRMLSGMTTKGSGLIAASRTMIRAFIFPRASIPLSQTIRALYDNSLPAFVSILAAFVLQWGTPPSWTLVFVVPLYLLIHVFGCGLMMVFARLTAEIPDVRALVGILTQAWFFLSGVMYSVNRFEDIPLAHKAMTLNPAYMFLTAVRECTIYRTMPDAHTWLHLVLWSFGTLLIGFVFFWQAEEKYVRIA